MTREETTAALRQFFAEHGEGLACAYLYGSVARDEARPTSDVDVAVLFNESAESPSRTVDLEGKLERALGRAVQAVDIERVDLDLVHRILRDGILVLESDRSRRIAFEVRARAEYFDLRPFLDEYRRTKASA
jgi:predicted nucleotidyltransferase